MTCSLFPIPPRPNGPPPLAPSSPRSYPPRTWCPLRPNCLAQRARIRHPHLLFRRKHRWGEGPPPPVRTPRFFEAPPKWVKKVPWLFLAHLWYPVGGCAKRGSLWPACSPPRFCFKKSHPFDKRSFPRPSLAPCRERSPFLGASPHHWALFPRGLVTRVPIWISEPVFSPPQR